MKQRAQSGLGIVKKQAQVITLEEEEKLWSLKLLGGHTPQSLLDTQLYLLGLHFALRGGVEHRRLKHMNSQISVHTDMGGARHLEYHEDVSKTNQGGLKSMKLTPKVTRAYENHTHPDRCIVRLYDQYNRLW